ncbi:MAG: CBS domain-containing protein, partial [Vicinamibacterales bacterium]
AQDGVKLPSQERERESRPLRVEDAMEPAWPDDPVPIRLDMATPVLHPDQTLDTALRQFGRHRVLPVVSRRDLSEVLGTLSLEDVMRRYGVQAAPREESGAATRSGVPDQPPK